MRKDSECPNLELDRLAKISHAIKDITITNESYRYYNDVKKAFVYLDFSPPPYLGNTNGHYNSVPDTGKFIEFVKKIEVRNLVMISEQNDPYALKLSDDFRVYPILLKRSLQYNTQNNSREIIAVNYALSQKLLNEDLLAFQVMAEIAIGGFKNEDEIASEFNNWICSYWARSWLNHEV